jgi:SAM-dependent methyltransferase
MPDPLQLYYETLAYPAMSHPPSDPALSAASARLRGHRPPHPSQATILEIGCGSGLNLIPLAIRWPKSRLVGIDLSRTAIAEAQSLAYEAKVSNVRFIQADLREFQVAPGSVDFIIAHGFLSWVPDDAKTALFAFCRHALSPQGLATISFNVEAGWRNRLPVIQKTKAILQAGAGDLMAALAILRSVTEPLSPEVAIIDDMIQKGAGILPFDDFAPINDPWSLAHVVEFAQNNRLKWLGESDYSENFRNAPEGTLQAQIAADEKTGRTFRSSIFVKESAEITDNEFIRDVAEWSVRRLESSSNDRLKRLFRSLVGDASSVGSCLPIEQLWTHSGSQLSLSELKQLLESGDLIPRIESVSIAPHPPEYPCLGAFRLACARRRLPLVDVWHRACAFPDFHYPVLESMDGTRDLGELSAVAKQQCPELAFAPWIRHLAARGMFEESGR